MHFNHGVNSQKLFIFRPTDKGQILKSYLYEGTPRVVDEVVLTVDDTDEVNVLLFFLFFFFMSFACWK